VILEAIQWRAVSAYPASSSLGPVGRTKANARPSEFSSKSGERRKLAGIPFFFFYANHMGFHEGCADLRGWPGEAKPAGRPPTIVDPGWGGGGGGGQAEVGLWAVDPATAIVVGHAIERSLPMMIGTVDEEPFRGIHAEGLAAIPPMAGRGRSCEDVASAPAEALDIRKPDEESRSPIARPIGKTGTAHQPAGLRCVLRHFDSALTQPPFGPGHEISVCCPGVSCNRAFSGDDGKHSALSWKERPQPRG